MLGPRPAPCLAPLPLVPCPGWTAILISMSITPAHVFIFWPHVGSSIINVKSWLACFYVQTVSYKWLPTAYFILQIAVWLCTVLACSPVVTPRLSSSILLSRVCSWMCVCVSVCVCLCVCVCGQWLTRVQHFVTSRTVAQLAPLSMGFPRQEYWSGLPVPSPGDLPNPGIEHVSCIGRQILFCWATRKAWSFFYKGVNPIL